MTNVLNLNGMKNNIVKMMENLEKNEMENFKTSEDLLNELVENYHGKDKEINEDFLEGCKRLLFVADMGSLFNYTVEEIGFCGEKGENHVNIVFRGAKGSALNEKDIFSVRIDENGNVDIFSYYNVHCDSDYVGYENIGMVVLFNIGKFNCMVSGIKDNMSEKFGAVASKVKNIIAGTDFKIKWYKKKNSILMIEDKDNNPFFLIKAKNIDDYGKLVVVGKCCDSFDWGVVEENYKKIDDMNLVDMFMFPNNFCESVCLTK